MGLEPHDLRVMRGPENIKRKYRCQIRAFQEVWGDLRRFKFWVGEVNWGQIGVRGSGGEGNYGDFLNVTGKIKLPLPFLGCESFHDSLSDKPIPSHHQPHDLL